MKVHDIRVKYFVIVAVICLSFLALSTLLWSVQANSVNQQARQASENTEQIIQTRINALSDQMLLLARQIDLQLSQAGDTWRGQLNDAVVDAHLRGSQMDFVMAWDSHKIIHLAREYEYFSDHVRPISEFNTPIIGTVVKQLHRLDGFHRGAVYIGEDVVYVVTLNASKGGTIVIGSHVSSMLSRMNRELGVNAQLASNQALLSASSPVTDTSSAANAVFIEGLVGNDAAIEVLDAAPDHRLGFFGWLALMSIATLIVLALIWSAFYQPLMQRIQYLLNELNQIQSHHDYSKRVSVEGQDEVARIGQRVNTVLAALEYAYRLMSKTSFVTSGLIESLDQKQQQLSHYQETDMAATDAMASHVESVSDLSRALDDDCIEVYFQPQYQLEPMQIAGVEALMRWFDKDRGLVAPQEVLDIAEQGGLSVALGERILTKTCAMASLWQKKGFDSTPVAVNVCRDYFYSDALIPQITRALISSSLEARLLEIEISEKTLADDSDQAHAILAKLKQLGVRVAIDNFTGEQVPLHSLPTWPVHKLKLSQIVLQHMTAERRGFLDSVVGIGKPLGLDVVVKGIEEQAQLSLMQTLSSTVIVQGMYTAQPMTGDEVEHFLGRSREGSAQLFNFPGAAG